MKNPFDIYTAKVKRFNIPLPEFEYFHKSSSEEKVDKKFIGRNRLNDRLYTWLSEEKTQSGSYLVTGYRGMGKSSYVGRLLNELCAQTNTIIHFIGIILYVIIWGGCIYLITDKNACHFSGVIVIFCIISLIAILYCIHFRYYIKHLIRVTKFKIQVLWTFIWKKKNEPFKGVSINAIAKRILRNKNWEKDWKKINNELYGTNIKKKRFSIISVNINLGQEVLNEKDVLCLITNGLYIKYRNYINSPIANFPHWLIKTTLITIMAYLANLLWQNYIFGAIIGRINMRVEIANNFFGYLLSIIFLAISYILYNYISKTYLSSQKRILQKLRFLNERLDASIDNEVGMNAHTSILSFNFNNRKKYPLANIREIEQELIDILDRINKPCFHPSFIFVFDELDKIDPSTSQETSPSNSIPEYTNEKNFPGGGTTRTRKQNVLKLLANMKLFVSTAKAKFIFISGRELYDAYLADLSDREFAISSVFNGIVYVESFCTNERKVKDIMSNAEIYISKQLIPKSFIKEECIEQYLKCIKENTKFDKLDIDLKLYNKYLITQYSKTKEYEEYNRSINNSCQSNNSSSQNNFNDTINCINKTIILLYHFSVYLYHISNGSPKKMNLYFEKFVKKTLIQNDFRVNKKIKKSSILAEKDINICISKKSKYHLSLGYLEQRKIGFIHYISYPVTQAIINANQFGDKLLVSASFLIDHIYKHHNSGFSWRNLEHTPELLEVYRIPEFRGFISSIISYLTQTHLIPITCGLYQFKFRKQFAEEISLASKFSEEIAALFNFTLDESLSVKKHYSEIQDMYHKKLQNEATDSPHIKAGIHHILADLYMSDEEYTNAIFEYQTAIRIIPFPYNSEENKDPHFISHMLFLIRNMLKLGLAYEKRKTYESAYVTYNELISRLINFRYIDEDNLGLDYFIIKNNNKDEWPTHKAILYAKKYAYTQLKEHEITKKVCPPLTSDTSEKVDEKTTFYTDGPNIITDFAHQMTIDKNPIIQRLSLVEDVRLVYQALLAKLFVLEKMELGGITHSNLELLESEYTFLHLATNEQDKFLISTDFFRRLGDIMYYKNGLAGQDTKSLFEGLYFWAYNVKTEVLDFCNENHCYNIKEPLTLFLSCFKNDSFTKLEKYRNREADWDKIFDTEICSFNSLKTKWDLSKYSDLISKFLRELAEINMPLNEINKCNQHRQKKWQDGKPLPCYACKYYNRSLQIIMKNLFHINIEEECKRSRYSKTIVILECLINGGSAKSLRQNFTIQLAEILECMGNTMLSCASEESKIEKDFLYAFLEDVSALNISLDQTNKAKSFQLIKVYKNEDTNNEKTLSKLERGILYYWEASECFRISNDLKKASGSLKKILRVIQNYLRVKKEDEERMSFLYEYNIDDILNKIKERIIKKSLIYLYSHYDYINITEIQKIKWVFSVQMYENISLNNLSLFPDIEEIMLIYYEMIKLCITPCNKDHRLRLSQIYCSTDFTTLRMESTIYERILSLRFRAALNQEIMNHLIFTCNKFKNEQSNYFSQFEQCYQCNYERLSDIKLDYYKGDFTSNFVTILAIYSDEKFKLAKNLGEYQNCFPHIKIIDEVSNKLTDKEIQKERDKRIFTKYNLLEFLIKDSMYCLTKILETITPYTSTTLFTNTFLGEVYQNLFEWNRIFDTLYMIYKTTESEITPPLEQINKLLQNVSKIKDKKDEDKKDENNKNKKNKELTLTDSLLSYKNYVSENIALRFFTFVLKETGKSNIHYTLNNYSAEMAIKCYRKAIEMHKEGKAYKEMISKMYYLDDDLKNDTIQFDSAIERYKINNGYIDKRIETIINSFEIYSLYDIENFTSDNEMKLSLDRFDKYDL